LQRVIESARAYRACFSAEYEFFFFRETPRSLREKNYRNLTPLSPGSFGYSVLRASENSELALQLFDQLTAFGIPIEGFHTETGPGVYEAAIAVDEALAAADKAALFKTAVKEIASRHGLIPTFMAKWNAELPGSSGHLHQSLWDAEKQHNLFSDGAGGMSSVMQHYIAGLVANLPELAAVFCPTVNSYKRTVRARGPHQRDLGRGQSHHGDSRNPRRRKIDARRAAPHRRRHQSVSGDRRVARGRT